MCAGYRLAAVFVTGGKKLPKLRNVCGRGGSAWHGMAWHGLLCELHVEGGSGFRNFIWITKSSLKILPQKISPRIQRKDTKFREAFRLLIGLAITLMQLANGDLSVNFISAAFVFTGNKIYRIAFLITVFVSAKCAVRTVALDCQSTIKVRPRVNRWNYANKLPTERRKELRAQSVHSCRLSAVFHPIRQTTDTVRVQYGDGPRTFAYNVRWCGRGFWST